VLKGLQEKISVTENDLLCGTHYPQYEPAAQALRERGEKPTSNRHNCSGKHTGMLAQARLRGVPTADYINPEVRDGRHILISPFATAVGGAGTITPTQNDWGAAKSEI